MHAGCLRSVSVLAVVAIWVMIYAFMTHASTLPFASAGSLQAHSSTWIDDDGARSSGDMQYFLLGDSFFYRLELLPGATPAAPGSTVRAHYIAQVNNTLLVTSMEVVSRRRQLSAVPVYPTPMNLNIIVYVASMCGHPAAASVSVSRLKPFSLPACLCLNMASTCTRTACLTTSRPMPL